MQISVLFVCLGNICRSPMAEAVFRHLVRQEGLEDNILIDSAGTGDWHVGEPPHHGTRKKLDEMSISYEGLRARQFKAEDVERFTYIIGMDDNNIADMKAIYNRHAAGTERSTRNLDTCLRRFVDFIPGTTYTKVPDPWYTGDFDETYRLISSGCRHLLTLIKQEHSL